jgi:hypothetical protein
VQLLLEAWGQHAVTADALVQAVEAAGRFQEAAATVRLAKLLHKVHSQELRQLFEGKSPSFGSAAVQEVLRERASDVSSLDKQWAAVRKRQEAVREEQHSLQQQVVHVAGMASNRS